MAPVNPYAMPPAATVGQAATPTPAQARPAASPGFAPGLDAPRAASRLSDLIAGNPEAAQAGQQPQPAAAGPAGNGFGLAELSAYAALVMEAESPARPAARPQATALAPGEPAARPLRPGSMLDFKA